MATFEELKRGLAIAAGVQQSVDNIFGLIEKWLTDRQAVTEAEKERQLKWMSLRNKMKYGGAGLSKIITDLRKEFDSRRQVKQFDEVSFRVNSIKRAWEAYRKNPSDVSKAALDEVIIIGFEKMLDPDSVVRASEAERLAQMQGILDRWLATPEKLRRGGKAFTDTERSKIVNMASIVFESYKKEYNRTVNFFHNEAIRHGVPENEVGRVTYNRQIVDEGFDPYTVEESDDDTEEEKSWLDKTKDAVYEKTVDTVSSFFSKLGNKKNKKTDIITENAPDDGYYNGKNFDEIINMGEDTFTPFYKSLNNDDRARLKKRIEWENNK